MSTNRRIVLASRPRGAAALSNFRLEECAVPAPAEGELLLETLYLSLDPYMRNLMNAAGTSYAPPMTIGAPLVGGTVARVLVTKDPRFSKGDLVLAQTGWQEFACATATDVTLIGDDVRPSLALGGLGMPGFTAYVGLEDIGRPQPGETVVVGAATGGVGSVVGQLAKLAGARVVGIAGGVGKCRFAEEELGFDACVDRHAPDLPRALADACPDGVDVYFENVGGAVFEAVLPLLNLRARIPVCGFIAHYDEDASAGPNRLPAVTSAILQKRIRMEGFIVLDHYGERFDVFRQRMREWLARGQVKLIEDMIDGIENAPAALLGLLQGRNFGKVVVRVERPSRP